MGAPASRHNPAVASLPAGVRENNGACCCFLAGAKTVPNEVPFVRFCLLPCLFFQIGKFVDVWCRREAAFMSGTSRFYREGLPRARGAETLCRQLIFACCSYKAPVRTLQRAFFVAREALLVAFLPLCRCFCRMARAHRCIGLVGLFGGESRKSRRLPRWIRRSFIQPQTSAVAVKSRGTVARRSWRAPCVQFVVPRRGVGKLKLGGGNGQSVSTDARAVG
ncbi:hypothetical protein TRVL_10176 [Trypanosoma vivax]|nr:hypothetical protein TRVL_10176 [Trypanosoma vivax]